MSANLPVSPQSPIHCSFSNTTLLEIIFLETLYAVPHIYPVDFIAKSTVEICVQLLIIKNKRSPVKRLQELPDRCYNDKKESMGGS